MKATGDLEFTKHMFTKLVPRHIENERMLGRGDGGARGRNPFIVKIHDFFPPPGEVFNFSGEKFIHIYFPFDGLDNAEFST